MKCARNCAHNRPDGCPQADCCEDFIPEMFSCAACKYNDGQKCTLFGRVIGMHGCSNGEPRKPKTNGDRIRAMTDEGMAFELACSGCPKEHFIKDNEFVDCPAEREPSKADCVKCWLDYLKQEVDAE